MPIKLKVDPQGSVGLRVDQASNIPIRLNAREVPFLRVSEQDSVNLRVRMESVSAHLGSELIAISANPYSGSYYVVPKAEEAVILPTANKTLVHDVTVAKVPYYETSNLSGGLTAYIASEV